MVKKKTHIKCTCKTAFYERHCATLPLFSDFHTYQCTLYCYCFLHVQMYMYIIDLPCISMTLCDPALWCSLSIFWVTTVTLFPWPASLFSKSATALWPALGTCIHYNVYIYVVHENQLIHMLEVQSDESVLNLLVCCRSFPLTFRVCVCMHVCMSMRSHAQHCTMYIVHCVCMCVCVSVCVCVCVQVVTISTVLSKTFSWHKSSP